MKLQKEFFVNKILPLAALFIMLLFSANTYAQQYSITVTASPSYAGTVEIVGSNTVTSGTSVTVIATANSGFRFKNWTGGNDTWTNPTYTFVCLGNTNLTATFELDEAWKKNGTKIYYNDGNVGIGTQNPDQKLTIKGKVHAEEVIIDLTVPQPDYVFEEGYNLKPLNELETYVKENKHLPGIPTADEVSKNGLSAGEMQAKLLEKVEELTLYTIQLKRENERLEMNLKKIKNEKAFLKKDL
jgi:hypothetical protein